MSGHSKWHNIQGRKGKQDALRSNTFTKLCRGITVAAREGGKDPDSNVSLRVAIEKAKEASVPRDNIDRAIARGTGELKDGADIHELVYEGYATGGTAVLVEAMTDNVTRTAGDMKHLFNKYGGSLGSPGSVQWQFERLGVVRLDKEQITKNKEPASVPMPIGTTSGKQDIELKLIDAGADDIVESEFGVEIRCSIPALNKVLAVVQSLGITPESSGFEWVAKETIKLDDSTSLSVSHFVEALDELDDVKEVYTNEA
jgi:YebC/PmpR family DNA-binding regulatory protein